MSLLLAIWHLIPGWAWGGGGVAVLVLVALVFFAPTVFANVLTSAGKLVAMIPWSKWQTWALIGAAVAIAGFKVWLDVHDQAVRAEAVAEGDRRVAARDTYWKGREKASNERYAGQLHDLQAYIDGERAKHQASADKLRQEAAAEKAKAASAADELKKARSENVTEEARRLCTVTRGMVLQFNAGAAYANGGDQLAVAAASAAGGLSRGAAAGISLDSYLGAVDGAHAALRSCRAQVIGWQRYHAEVIEPWIATAIEAVKRCTPKGSSP